MTTSEAKDKQERKLNREKKRQAVQEAHERESVVTQSNRDDCIEVESPLPEKAAATPSVEPEGATGHQPTKEVVPPATEKAAATPSVEVGEEAGRQPENTGELDNCIPYRCTGALGIILKPPIGITGARISINNQY